MTAISSTPKLYGTIRTKVETRASFSGHLIPPGTLGTIVECYSDPKGYAVDLAIPDLQMVSGYHYENVILLPDQFEMIY